MTASIHPVIDCAVQKSFLKKFVFVEGFAPGFLVLIL
jgi:hypothetical protein